MHETEDMERFIAEQRNKIARDRDTLQRNPTSAVTDYIMDEAEKRSHIKSRRPVVVEENMIPDPVQHEIAGKQVKTKPPTPQLFKLGEDYLKQKEKLKEELRLEYRKALAEKQVRTTGIRGQYSENYAQNAYSKKDPNDLGLSLPIRDHLSAKERLMLERNREYNQFKAAQDNARLTRTKNLTNSPIKLAPEPTAVSVADPSNQLHGTNQAVPSKSATETYKDLLDRKRRQEKAYRDDDDDDGVDLDDRVIYREKPRRRNADIEDDARSLRRNKPTNKRRPRYQDRYRDSLDDSLDEDEEELLLRKIRARRQRKRLNQRFPDSDDEDNMLFERVQPKVSNLLQEPPESKRRLSSAQNRDVGRKPVYMLNEKENDSRSKSAPPEQEYTGLLIGKVTSANTVQRRKDEYKHDLQRQMEQKDINRKREKELELRIDASGANFRDIQELTPRKQNKKRGESPQDNRAEKPKKKGKKKTTFKEETSESSSEEEIRKMPRQPMGYYPPPKPSFYQPMPQQFHSPYDEAYYYYGARNPLDAGLAPPGAYPPPMNQPGMQSGMQPGLQPGISPLMAAAAGYTNPGAVPSGAGSQQETSQKSILSSRRTGSNVESSLVSDENRDDLKKREKMLVYQEELKEQMNLKEKKVKAAKAEQERYDRKIEQEAQNYNPWGKGGAGAPMRDVHGNLISDLRQMHLVNEELDRDPSKLDELVRERQHTRIDDAPVLSPRSQRDPLEPESTMLSPRFGRSNPFETKETREQKSQKDVYKENLQKQIEERRRLEDERREKQRLEDEKQERRMEEQNKRMQEEYENEKRKQREKIEQKRRENEEMQRALEEKRKESERVRKEEQLKEEQQRTLERERELTERLKKPSSPPIHAKELHGSHESKEFETGQNTYRSQPTHRTSSPPRHQVREQPARYERARSPVVEPRPEKSRESKRISRELSALRKQLLSEQRRIESQLRSADTTGHFNTYKPANLKSETLVDLSRTRQRPVQVRRPPTVDRPNSKALREFTDFKHRQDDTASLRMFRIEHPETPKDAGAFEAQQQQLIKTQQLKLEALRGNKSLDQPQFSGKSPTKTSRNGFSLLPPSDSYASLLDAESMYIPITDADNLENQPPSAPESRGSRRYSARERRRISKRNEEEGFPSRAPDTYSINSLTSLATLDVDRLANKNENRLDKLKALTGDEVSLTDPDDILDRFVNQHRPELPDTPDIFQPRAPRKGTSISAPQPRDERPPSVNTLDTEPWLRPGTGPPATAT